MDLTTAIFIGFLAGYHVFKEIMWHKHVQKLEAQLATHTTKEFTLKHEDIDPAEKENTISQEDPLIDIDEAPNPFAPAGNVRLSA